jgi:enoyl-CoA hydratase
VTEGILFEQRGSAGCVVLDRPKALNALTHAMVVALHGRLAAWASDPAITRIVVTARGERAFCAGGDIRALYELGRNGEHGRALAFWRDEYRLNALIKWYPKPYVSLVDGIVMGGGAGISVNGSHMIAGDRLQFAMPEVGIGLFPDIGATYFLPRLPGQLGAYLALTADRLSADDAVAAGVASHRVASARLADVTDALCGNCAVDTILADVTVPVAEPHVGGRFGVINRLFAPDRVEDILAGLDAETGADAEWARATAATIRTKAPLSLAVALAQVRRGWSWSFAECVRTEFRLVSRFVYEHDYYEGVRALIIDKDNRPRWRPPTLADVSEADVESHFAPLEDELELP